MMKQKKMILAALFAAITAVFSQIAIPLPSTSVPFTLSIIAVFLTGALLDKKYAFLSQVVYLMLGLCGLPVFSQFGSGIARLLGPTGGYLLAYPLVSYTIAYLTEKYKKTHLTYILSMTASLVLLYILGTAWLAFVSQMGIVGAFFAGVVPFVLFDFVKIIISTSLALALNKIIVKSGHVI